MGKKTIALFVAAIVICSGLIMIFLPNNDYDAYKDVEYGSHERQKMDIYLPKKVNDMKEPAPAFMYVHGGGWSEGDKLSGAGYREAMQNMGITLVSINYRLINYDNDIDCWNMMEDIGSAISFLNEISKKYKIDISRMAIGGDSAGGHLSMLYAYSNEGTAYQSRIPISFVMSNVGPADLTDEDYFNGTSVLGQEFATYLIKRLAGLESGMGDVLSDDDIEPIRMISPITYVNSGIPPTIMAYGVMDDIVPYRNAEDMAVKMLEGGASFSMYVFDRSGHTLGAQEDETVRQQYFEELVRYFRTYLT